MLLDVNSLVTGFDIAGGFARAVDGVSFQIKSGKSFCLVGESGCGKSVTVLSLLRLLPSPPSRVVSGTAIFEGQDLLSVPDRALEEIRGRKIGMIFQEPMTSLNPVFRVGEQIAEGLRHHLHLGKAEALKEAIGLLEQVGISAPTTTANDYPHQLSGGMRQRVMIAMAMACKPLLLIADEPTTALDVSIQGQILSLMRSMREAYGAALLMITHDLDVVAQTADEMAVMYAGKIVESGSVEAVLSHPLHPYTKGLIASRPRLSVAERKKRLEAIPGTVPSPLDRPLGCGFSTRCRYANKQCHEEMPELSCLEGGATDTAAHFCRCWLAGK